MFEILNGNSGDTFRGLMSKYFPELPAGNDSPTYSYLIAPIETAFNTYHSIVKRDLDILRSLAVGSSLSQEYINSLPQDTLDFFGTLHGMSRMAGLPVWGVLKVKTVSSGTVTFPELSFSTDSGTYRTFPATVDSPTNRLVYISYTATDMTSPVIPFGTEVTLASADISEAYSYLYKPAVPQETNYEFYERIMASVSGRSNPIYNLLLSSADTVSGNTDITIVGTRDNRMFRDIVAIETDPNPTFQHTGGKIDVYIPPNQITYQSAALVSGGLTASQKELLLTPKTMLLDYGVALVDGTVVAVDYPGRGTFIQEYVNNWPRVYELPLDIPVIDISGAFTGAVLDVLSVSSSSGSLTEGTDYVWISGDRGGSFTHRQKSLLVFNPDLHEEGSAYTVYALVADSWDSVNELFSSLTGELVGLDVLLKPFNPVTTVVTLTVKGETSLDKGTLVGAINGSPIFDLGEALRALTDSGTPLVSIETSLRLRTPTYYLSTITGVSTATNNSFISNGIPFSDLYRFYTAPDLITIVEV